MKILELTFWMGGEKLYVNADKIERIEAHNEKTAVVFERDVVYVQESPAKVALMCGDITFAAVEGE